MIYFTIFLSEITNNLSHKHEDITTHWRAEADESVRNTNNIVLYSENIGIALFFPRFFVFVEVFAPDNDEKSNFETLKSTE